MHPGLHWVRHRGYQVSPPPTPGIPERFPLSEARSTIHDRLTGVEARTAAVEVHTAQLVSDVGEIKKATDRFVGYEATVKQWMGRLILWGAGLVGTTYGVTRATLPTAQPERTVVTKSATTVKVEACTSLQPGPERDQCAIQILTELMGPRR